MDAITWLDVYAALDAFQPSSLAIGLGIGIRIDSRRSVGSSGGGGTPVTEEQAAVYLLLLLGDD